MGFIDFFQYREEIDTMRRLIRVQEKQIELLENELKVCENVIFTLRKNINMEVLINGKTARKFSKRRKGGAKRRKTAND